MARSARATRLRHARGTSSNEENTCDDMLPRFAAQRRGRIFGQRYRVRVQRFLAHFRRSIFLRYDLFVWVESADTIVASLIAEQVAEIGPHDALHDLFRHAARDPEQALAVSLVEGAPAIDCVKRDASKLRLNDDSPTSKGA